MLAAALILSAAVVPIDTCNNPLNNYKMKLIDLIQR
jgi:hypothetical protein